MFTLFCLYGNGPFFGIKFPILFVYYDLPFYAYQDKIISFCVVTYAIFFFGAYQNLSIAPYAIVAMIATVFGLSLINFSDALKSVLEGGTTTFYWLQTGMIASILVWLLVFYLRTKKSNAK